MPWSRKTAKLARAVAHGFKPTGSAKGFTTAFARQVIAEGVKGKTIGDLTRRKKRND